MMNQFLKIMILVVILLAACTGNNLLAPTSKVKPQDSTSVPEFLGYTVSGQDATVMALPYPPAVKDTPPTNLPVTNNTRTPLPTQPPAYRTPVPATQIQPDCERFPGLGACLSGSTSQPTLPLTGKLAIYDPNQQTILILDLGRGMIWQASAPEKILRLDWMAAGQVLVGFDDLEQRRLYWWEDSQPPQLPPQRLGDGPELIRSPEGNLAWLEFSPDSLQSTTHVLLKGSSRELVTQLPINGPRFHDLLSWAPGTTLLLGGYHYGGNGMWSVGNYLYVLDASSGEIKELGASMKLVPHYEWHPSHPGILAFTNSLPGSFHVSVMDIRTGEMLYQMKDDRAISNYPAWTKDGAGILYEVRLTEGISTPADSPFTANGIYLTLLSGEVTRQLTQPPPGYVDSWAQPLADGQHFLFMRHTPEGSQAELRQGSMDGRLDALVARQIPYLSFPAFGITWEQTVAFQP